MSVESWSKRCERAGLGLESIAPTCLTLAKAHWPVATAMSVGAAAMNTQRNVSARET